MKFYTNVACRGNHIYYRGVENGRRVHLKLDYSPTLFVPSQSPQSTVWKDLNGRSIDTVQFSSIYEAREYLKKYSDVEGFTIYGNSNFQYTFISDQHQEDSIEWNISDVVVAYIDIEVGTEHGMPTIEKCENPITAITIKLSNSSYYDVFGCGAYTKHRGDIRYHYCTDESDLIEKFLEFWKENYPDVVSGWNVKTFDIPYIVGRMCALPLFGEERTRWLSPWGKITIKEEQFYGKDQRVFELLGISILDYMQLFRKYAPNASQPSYKLDYIAHVELKEKKLDYSEYDNLHDLYKKNYQKFIEYNIRDVELVEKLNSKGRLIDMALTLAYDNKTNYEDVFSQVRMWDVICYNHLRKKHIAVPPKKDHIKKEAYEGAYVKDPQIGRYRWVSSFDLDSLYPHLIMQYNLSPDMLIEPSNYTEPMKALLRQPITVDDFLAQRLDLSVLQGFTMTPNGQFFRTDKQGFLAEIMQTMYDARSTYKKKQLEFQKEKEKTTDPSRIKELENLISRFKNLQLAKKVGLNSAYGAMGNEFFRFFDVRIAEAVTLAGQLSIRWIEFRLNAFMNKTLKTDNVDYVLASDTDSIYLHLGPLADKVFGENKPTTPDMIEWMDKACQKINGFIADSYQELATYVHAYQQKMRMKRESLVDTAIWTAKKRYILNVWDQEGVRYKEPDLKIQGLEAIKSSTPSACRDKIKEAIKIIMTGTQDDLIAFIDKFRAEFKTLPLSEISFPRTANGLENWKGVSSIYIKGTPMHVKAALAYNHFLTEHNLQNDYELIRSGEKIKFIAIQEPNVFGVGVMGFMTRIPKELALDSRVDYKVQFEKSFIDPLRIILDSIGWKTEKVSTLDKFFG